MSSQPARCKRRARLLRLRGIQISYHLHVQEVLFVGSANKRKRDVVKDPEKDYGLITDTAYHGGSIFSRTFQYIYEEF